MLVPTYYLPIHFEAVKDHTATKAGLDLLGVILSLIIVSTVGGFVVRKYGRYNIFLISGPMFCMVAAGLLFTIRPSTSFAKIIGYEILMGVGIGQFFQLGMLAAQAEFATKPYMMGKVMGVISFGQMLGGTVGLAIAGSIFDQKLTSNLAKCEYPFFGVGTLSD
jgi:MFS family permease